MLLFRKILGIIWKIIDLFCFFIYNESKNIDFALRNVCKDDNIYVEFVSDKLEKNTVNNSTILLALADSIKVQLQSVNPYAEILNSARSIF